MTFFRDPRQTLVLFLTLGSTFVLGGCGDLPETPADIDARPYVLDLGTPEGDGTINMGIPDPDGATTDSGGEAVDFRRPPPIDAARPSPDAGMDMTPTPEVDMGMPMVARGAPLYPAGQVHSPMPADVVERLRAVHAMNDQWRDDVFMKIGASSTVSRSTLHCFAGDNVDLADHDALQTTLDYFLDGDAGDTTPFDRVTVAARVGHSANWAIRGDPSPVEEETAATQPRFGLVHYGTNDMGLGSTYASAMLGFYDNMTTLLDDLLAQGIIPILTGISHRGDRVSANRWVPSYNAVIRGMAQVRGVPFIDLYWAQDLLDGHGLAGDGIHLNGYRGGPCVLTDEGLAFGYNVRNLIVLETLDRLRRVLFDAEDRLDDAPRLAGQGTYEAPFLITTLPFADGRDTGESNTRVHDEYPACDDANEAGPEYVYRYTTDRRRRVRAIVLDSGSVDIDVHLLDQTGRAAGCIDRNHNLIETTLEPGTYHFVLDTFVGGNGVEKVGPYLFALIECDADDGACD